MRARLEGRKSTLDIAAYIRSASQPLRHLSAARPHANVFGPYVLSSLLGQFAVHITYLVVVYRNSLEEVSALLKIPPPLRPLRLPAPATLPSP